LSTFLKSETFFKSYKMFFYFLTFFPMILKTKYDMAKRTHAKDMTAFLSPSARTRGKKYVMVGYTGKLKKELDYGLH
jgi:hypothetical protein